MTKRKKIALILGSIAAVLLAFAALLIKGAYDYVEQVPDITPIAESMSFPTNTIITAEDLADIQKATYTKMFVSNLDGALPHMNYHSTELNTGEFAGTFDVSIDAGGENAEHRSVTITVTVTEEQAS